MGPGKGKGRTGTALAVPSQYSEWVWDSNSSRWARYRLGASGEYEYEYNYAWPGPNGVQYSSAYPIAAVPRDVSTDRGRSYERQSTPLDARNRGQSTSPARPTKPGPPPPPQPPASNSLTSSSILATSRTYSDSVQQGSPSWGGYDKGDGKYIASSFPAASTSYPSSQISYQGVDEGREAAGNGSLEPFSITVDGLKTKAVEGSTNDSFVSDKFAMKLGGRRKDVKGKSRYNDRASGKFYEPTGRLTVRIKLDKRNGKDGKEVKEVNLLILPKKCSLEHGVVLGKEVVSDLGLSSPLRPRESESVRSTSDSVGYASTTSQQAPHPYVMSLALRNTSGYSSSLPAESEPAQPTYASYAVTSSVGGAGSSSGYQSEASNYAINTSYDSTRPQSSGHDPHYTLDPHTNTAVHTVYHRPAGPNDLPRESSYPPATQVSSHSLPETDYLDHSQSY